MSLLTDNERAELVALLKETLLDFMFGDGHEELYVLEGIEFKGLNNMSDEELLLELGHYTEGDTPEIMAAKWISELNEEE